MNLFHSTIRIRKWLLLAFAALVSGIMIASVIPNESDKSQLATHRVREVLRIAPELGLVVDGRLRVVDVVPGGAAEQAGIKKGDILKSINTQRPTTLAEVEKTLKNLETSKSVSLSVQRGSKELRVEIIPIIPQGTTGAPTPTAVPSDMMYF